MNLSFFNTTNLFESATELFGLLNIKLNSNTTEPLPVRDLLKQHFKETEIFNSIEKTFYIGTLDNTVLGATVPPERDYKQAVEQADKNYEGLMLFCFAVEQATHTNRNFRTHKSIQPHQSENACVLGAEIPSAERGSDFYLHKRTL